MKGVLMRVSSAEFRSSRTKEDTPSNCNANTNHNNGIDANDAMSIAWTIRRDLIISCWE